MLSAALNTIFPVVFIGLTLGYLVKIRTIPGEDGEDLLILVLICDRMPVIAPILALGPMPAHKRYSAVLN